MRKISLLLTLALACQIGVSGQSLKDKLKNATSGGSSSSEVTTATDAPSGPTDQLIESKKFLEGPKMHMMESADGNWFQRMDGSGPGTTKLFIEREIKKDESGNVIMVKDFPADDKTKPLFYGSLATKDAAIFLDGFLFLIDLDIASGKVNRINYIYCTQKLKFGAKYPESDLIAKLENYIKENRGAYDQRNKDAEIARQKEQERQEKEAEQMSSVEGKDIQSIRIVFKKGEKETKEILYNEMVTVYVEATLKDGSKKLTPYNSKYADAYTISIKGITPKAISGSTIHQKYYDTPDDAITVSASWKKNPKISTTGILIQSPEGVSMYGADKFSFGSKHHSSDYRRKSPDARVEIKKFTHKVTKEEIIGYRVYFGSDSEPMFIFRVRANEYVKVHTDAARYETSDNVSVTQTGPPAGNIKVIMDPSVPESINFQTSAEGGTVKGNNKVTSSPGAQGRIETVKAAVSW